MIIYNIPEKEDELNNKLPSVSYLLDLIKILEDELIKHENSTTAHTEYDSEEGPRYTSKIDYTAESAESEDLPISVEFPEIHAEDIITDANHQFITNNDLAIFRDKPSTHEMNTAIMDVRNELKTSLSVYFNNLLNTTESVNKLKDIFTMIATDEVSSAIMDVLANKISLQDFREHTDSSMHLTDKDRKSLNSLDSFINKGCADWNAKPDEPNYIRNKPTALPAFGGDAETVMGYSIQDLYNTQLEDYIVGIIENDEDDIDGTTINLNNNTDKSVEWFFSVIKEDTEGVYSFKKGIYPVERIDLDYGLKADTYGDIMILGSGPKNTVFDVRNMRLASNTTFRDCGFICTAVCISELATFDNVEFTNCEIVFETTRLSTFRNCTFNACVFRFVGTCNNNVIVNNRFKSTIVPQYYGGNNLIANNLAY